MKELKIQVNTSTLEESNDYLMRMWAVMINQGKIGWHYRPFKSDSIIEVGDLDIHGLGCYYVKIMCKTKRTFSFISFSRHDGKDFNAIEKQYFKSTVEAIGNIVKQRFLYRGKINIESQFGVKFLYPLEFEEISIYCINDNQFIEFTVHAYSKEEANEIGLITIGSILDILSIQTNSCLKLERLTLCKTKYKISEDVEYKLQADENWVDDYPIENDHFMLPKYAKIILNKVINNSGELNVLIRSSHHFRNALGLIDKEVQEDLIVSQIMSSIEVITEINEYQTEQCETCKQPRFSIRKRVLDLIENEMASHMRKIFSDYYDQRSKYLHTGEIRSKRVFAGLCLPQISDSTKSGCTQYPVRFDFNLIELVGWLLRKMMIERF